MLGGESRGASCRRRRRRRRVLTRRSGRASRRRSRRSRRASRCARTRRASSSCPDRCRSVAARPWDRRFRTEPSCVQPSRLSSIGARPRRGSAGKSAARRACRRALPSLALRESLASARSTLVARAPRSPPPARARASRSCAACASASASRCSSISIKNSASACGSFVSPTVDAARARGALRRAGRDRARRATLRSPRPPSRAMRAARSAPALDVSVRMQRARSSRCAFSTAREIEVERARDSERRERIHDVAQRAALQLTP